MSTEPTDEFYILSLRWSKRRDKVLTFWDSNDSGYRYRLEMSGRYTREQIEAHHDYYDNGESTRAVPCAEAEALAQKVGETDSKSLDVDRNPEERVVAYKHIRRLRKPWLAIARRRMGDDAV